MGLEQTIRFPRGAPSWEAARDLLGRWNYPVQLRMMDGELLFPDELPPETWRELRVATPHGMVTLHREAGTVSFVIWGNADSELLRARNALMAAFAEAGGGFIQTEAGSLTSTQFRDSAELPDGFRGRS